MGGWHGNVTWSQGHYTSWQCPGSPGIHCRNSLRDLPAKRWMPNGSTDWDCPILVSSAVIGQSHIWEVMRLQFIRLPSSLTRGDGNPLIYQWGLDRPNWAPSFIQLGPGPHLVGLSHLKFPHIPWAYFCSVGPYTPRNRPLIYHCIDIIIFYCFCRKILWDQAIPMVLR